jgi:hypothetical protein
MKLEEVKAICREFDPVRNSEGKVVCTNSLSGDRCRNPGHFVCDVALVSKKVGIQTSMSRVRNWLKCQRSWAFRYYYNAKPFKTSVAMDAGKEFSNCRAKIDNGQTWKISDTLPLVERAKLEIVLNAYALQGRRTANCEALVSKVIGWEDTQEITLIGYLDGISDDRTVIDEWKYTERPDTWDLLKVSLQASSYFACVPTAKTFNLCLARRPSQELLLATPPDKRKYTAEKKCSKCKGKGCPECVNGVIAPRLYEKQREVDETVEQYQTRIIDSIGDSLFSYTSFLRDEFDIEGDIKLIQRVYRSYTAASKQGVFLPNYHSCEYCEWRDWCKTHPKGPCSEECVAPQVCARMKITNEMNK